MNKREFLDLLRYYLRSYPSNIINDMIVDYEEHFRIGLENGKTEEEISKELGSPKDIAEEFYQHELPPKQTGANPYVDTTLNASSNLSHNNGLIPNNIQKSKSNSSMWFIILMIVGLIILFPPILGVALAVLIAFVGILFSLFAIVLALGITGGMSLIGWAFPIYNMVTIYGARLHPITSVFLGLFLISLSILVCYLTISFITLCSKAFKNLYLSIRWSIAKRRKN